MLKRAVLVVQMHLKDGGHFHGTVDGKVTPVLDAAILKGLERRRGDIPPDGMTVSPKRRITMLFQLICRDRAIDPGPIDGFWGPSTQDSYDRLMHLIERGTLPPNWRDDPPSDANPHVWPRDTGNQDAMRAFYGLPGAPPMTRVRVPWKLRLAWNKATTITHIGCHAKVAGSVDAVLQKVHAHYGEAELKRLRLDLYGGCFMNRKKRGGSSWSTHAWAVALDWDPERNQLNFARDRATLDHGDYDAWWHAWEAEGWVSLGRSRNFDWMHVQAARL